MSKVVIYSFKEYQEKYNLLLNEFNLEYEECDEIDFINIEIKNYNICFRIVNFPIDKAFNQFFRIEYGTNLKTFSISKETYDFIFSDENDAYYYRIYIDIVESSRASETKINIEKKIKHARLMIDKIISFLETKKADIYREQALPIQQTENKNLRDKLFKINEKNFLDIAKEYSFSENEGFFIKRNFWPIIVVNSFNAEWIKNELDFNKIEFRKENKIFNLDIFKRNELDLLMFELNEYLDNLSKGKTKIWDERKGDYFHWFKLQLDTKSYTLLISDKNEIQLEIYFKTLLSEISKFIENEQTLPFQLIEAKLEQVNNEKVFSFQQTEQHSIIEALTKLKSINKIDLKNIIGSGFIKAFISEYYEDKIHSHYPEKDRLLYVMCNSETEKDKITAKKIKQTSLKIKKLGNEDLSFAYVLSCKVESLANFIKSNERFDFWLNKFCEKFIDSIISFTPILYACELIPSKQSNDFFEDEFWNFYPASEKPKENSLHFILEREAELLFEIENIIDDFVKNEYWEFDFNVLKKYTDVSKPMELLFNISELFVQLNRLEMFNEFNLSPQKSETKPDLGRKESISKPCFKPESIESTISILNIYFDTTQHAELKQIIETGGNTREKLLFKDNGNKLTDCFKQLYENNTIVGCSKTTLINWIIDNFKYNYRGTQKDYIFETVEKIISSTDRLCKNPII